MGSTLAEQPDTSELEIVTVKMVLPGKRAKRTQLH